MNMQMSESKVLETNIFRRRIVLRANRHLNYDPPRPTAQPCSRTSVPPAFPFPGQSHDVTFSEQFHSHSSKTTLYSCTLAYSFPCSPVHKHIRIYFSIVVFHFSVSQIISFTPAPIWVLFFFLHLYSFLIRDYTISQPLPRPISPPYVLVPSQLTRYNPSSPLTLLKKKKVHTYNIHILPHPQSIPVTSCL